MNDVKGQTIFCSASLILLESGSIFSRGTKHVRKMYKTKSAATKQIGTKVKSGLYEPEIASNVLSKKLSVLNMNNTNQYNIRILYSWRNTDVKLRH